MTVAVVIPALNEEGNIGRLVQEIFRVIPQEILSEVIVIDDGSTDGTGGEIRSSTPAYPRLRYIRHRERMGQSAAIRTGVLAAHSPIIATMDGDAYGDWYNWHEEHSVIEVTRKMMKADCGVVGDEILNWSDYIRWKEARAKEGDEPQYPPDVLTLPLPGVK